jgi:hypothetical protein
MKKQTIEVGSLKLVQDTLTTTADIIEPGHPDLRRVEQSLSWELSFISLEGLTKPFLIPIKSRHVEMSVACSKRIGDSWRSLLLT